jgi:osmotically-inducible protein OsmY
MNFPRKNRILILCTYLGPAICGLVGFATPVGAQTSVMLPASASDTAAIPEIPGGAAVSPSGELRERVQAALHADPYFYDKHVNVTVEKGAVVLRGFVLSDWDLQEAIRIAGKAAGDRRVIDDLSIKQGGRR